MTSVTDITHFFTKCAKKDNDRINRLREQALLILNDDRHPFLLDETYGEKWKLLQTAFRTFLRSALQSKGLSHEYTSYTLHQRGGQQNHHDIDVRIDQGSNTRIDMLYEFKFENMPQFCQYYEDIGFISQRLTEYWYDHVLDSIIALYPPLTIPKPTKEIYLIGAKQALGKKSKASFFKQFYDWEHSAEYGPKSDIYKKKQRIVQQGISDFLAKHGMTFSADKLAAKLAEDHRSKIYAIWRMEKRGFDILHYTDDMLTPTQVDSIKNKNTIVLKTNDPSCTIHCLLRWKNTSGICNPAWQISMKRSVKPSPTQSLT